MRQSAIGAASRSYRAYGPNLALGENGGAAAVCCERDGRPTSALNDGQESVGYRYHYKHGAQPLGYDYDRSDSSPGMHPEWAQIEWQEAQLFTEVVLRLRVLSLLPELRRAIGKLTLQYWDSAAGEWRLVHATNGQPNPVLNWVAPITADGSEMRCFTFKPLTTAKVRVLFEDRNFDGWSILEEIEVYERRTATAPFVLRYVSGPGPGTVLQRGDECRLVVDVTDALGLAVENCPVTFTPLAAGRKTDSSDLDSGQIPIHVRTDRAGRGEALIETSRRVGRNTFSARSAPAITPAVEFQVPTLPLKDALATALKWLRKSAGELERDSQIMASDGTVMYTPDGVPSYAGFWVRDFQYMIEGYSDGIPIEHIRKGFEYLIARQRADGAMPNKVLSDGTPVYCPGPGCDSIFGPLPVPDNPQFMVKIASHYTRLTGDLSLFEQYKNQLVKGMEFLPRSPNTSLIYIPPENPSSPYGFTDAIAKTGDQLFDSLLYYEAAMNLAQLSSEAGDDTGASRWAEEGAVAKRDIQTLYDQTSGMFFAASIDCRQIDIWGSAYAAFIGAIPHEQQRRIASYLRANYDGIVRRGHVRHTAPGEYWERTIGPYHKDIYMNGAYWAVPSGWVATAISKVDRDLAARMLLDLVKDFQVNGINEAINPENAYVAVPKYVASATNPIPALIALSALSQKFT